MKISEGVLEFNKDITEYKLTVGNEVNNLTIDTKALSSKAKINLTNPTLVVGENKVKILVTAENGTTKEYVITVIKKGENIVLSSDNYLSSIEIENYNINFDRETLKYTKKIKDEESLIIKASPSNENSTVAILGNESLRNGSIINIIVTAENGETREYQINIQKGEVKISSGIPTQYIIIGLFVLVLIILIIITVIKKNKDKNKNIPISNNTNSENGINNVYNNSQPNNQNNITNDNPIQNSINNNVTNNMATDNNINNPSGLNKVCSSCDRKVPYEAETCPYCMTDFKK